MYRDDDPGGSTPPPPAGDNPLPATNSLDVQPGDSALKAALKLAAQLVRHHRTLAKIASDPTVPLTGEAEAIARVACGVTWLMMSGMAAQPATPTPQPPPAAA